MKPLRAPTAKPITLRAIRPNAGIDAWYRDQLQKLIAEMANSVQYWLTATWRAQPPLTSMAQDASPIRELRRTMDQLGRKWTKRFDQASEDLSAKFADKSIKHTNAAMQAALKDAGFAVPFKLTADMRETIAGTIAENVALIRTIPQQYLGNVESQVWRSIASGVDLATLTQELQANYGSTYKRASLIARDQSAKAHAAIESVRRKELGITRAIWIHSGAGREPRPEHVAAQGKEFDISKGMFLEGEWVLPGEAINCRCVSKSVISGWED